MNLVNPIINYKPTIWGWLSQNNPQNPFMVFPSSNSRTITGKPSHLYPKKKGASVTIPPKWASFFGVTVHS